MLAAASVRKMDPQEISIRQGRCRLRARFEDPAAGHMLQAPENGQMTRQVRESAACRAEYTLIRGKRILLHAVTDMAAAEYDEKKSSTENHKFSFHPKSS